MRKKTLSVNISAILLSTILLAKLIVDLVNKKKKVEEIYLELVCTIGIFLLCVVTAVFLTREKKEYKKIKHSNSNKEVEGKKQQLLKRSASCPGRLNNYRASGDKDEIDNYYNLTDQQLSVKNFGRDESIIAVTFPEKYSIKKYDNGGEIQSTKNGIIDDGDKYKLVDFSINKIKITNDKGKKEDSYQFTFKFQSTQKDDVYIEINCETLNVYSGWKENKEKPVTQYFKALKANDDFLIFLDVKEIFSKLLKIVLTFAQKVFPANNQGLSPVTGQGAYKFFELKLLQEKSSYYIHAKGFAGILNKKFPIKDILVSDQLINKKQEVEQEHQNDVDQDIQVDGPTNQKVTTGGETSNLPQPQSGQDEADLPNANSVPPSPSISSGIVSDNISSPSTSDIATTEQREECEKEEESIEQQQIGKSSSPSSSKSSFGSQGSIDSAGKQKNKIMGNNMLNLFNKAKVELNKAKVNLIKQKRNLIKQK